MKINKNSLNIIYLFSLEFFVRIIGFAATTYLARVLGTSGFGIINLGLAVLGYALLFGNSGLTLLGTRKVASDPANPGMIASDILSARFLLSISILVLSFFFISFFITSTEIKNVSLAYLLYLIPFAFLLEWFFQGLQKMGVITVGRIIGMVVYFIFLVVFVKSETDTLLTAVGWFLGGAVNSFILWLFFKKLGLKMRMELKNFNSILLIKESLSLSIASIISGLAITSPIIYLGIVASSSDVGLYSAAYKIIVLFLTIDRVFNVIFFPKIINCINNYRDKLNDIFSSILKIILLIALSTSIIEIICGEFLINLIFGDNFLNAILIFQILTGYFSFTLINSVFTFTLIGMKKEKIYTLSLLWGAMIYLFLSIVLYNWYSILSPSISLVFFEIISLFYMAVKLKEFIKINIMKNLIIPVIGTYGVILPILIFIDLSLIIKVLIAFVFATPLIAVLVNIKIDDLKYLKRILI